jgi:predicted RNA-binding Zn ribbon-like protein
MDAPTSGARRLLAFLQSRDHESDAFAGGASATGWLVGHGALASGAMATDDDASNARRLRAALLALVQDRDGALGDARTAGVLSAVSHAAPLAVMAEGSGVRLAACGAPADAALGELLADLYRAEVSGDLGRLKACKACGWAFFDTSKNRSRVWCDMSRCGAQAKSRAYRRRHATA